MIIEPSIRSNIFTNAHPIGCQAFVEEQVRQAKALEPFDGPKTVLIIGGSSGYGLSSRIALAFGANAHTINVSYESAPKGKRPGSAGWWNNIHFQNAAASTGNYHKDFIGDAFGLAMKEDVIAYLKTHHIKLDLVIYSLAAGARKDEKTGETIRSYIKAIGEPAVGKTIDIAELKVVELEVPSATDQEIADTVFVMGGGDWSAWIHALDEANCLNQGIKTISYTYIGGPTTDKLYRGGTLGKAKEDLEAHAQKMHEHLKSKYQGEALISSSKAVVTKASVFIPQMPVYVACLYDVMMRHHVHETILEHKYRLFKDMVYGNQRITDDHARIRLDHLEMDPVIQKETIHMMHTLDEKSLFELKGTQRFLDEFYQIHGFRYDDVDYDQDLDLEVLAKIEPK